MRNIALAIIAASLGFVSGCGCGHWQTCNRPGSMMTSDPEQAEWHRCLFGTRYVPVVAPCQFNNPNFFHGGDKKSE